jgi:hypothetical protein
MRALAAVLLALVLSACAQPPSTGPTPAGSTTAPSIAGPATASPAAVGDALVGLLPASVAGSTTTTSRFDAFSRRSPRVFLKVIARVGKIPPDAQLALAYTPSATVYAVQVDGVTGNDILQAFLVERMGAAGASAAPTVDIGGKQVVPIGASARTFGYASGDTFFYVDCQDEETAADALNGLP